MLLRFVRHICMHVHLVMIMDRNHADNQLCHMIMIIAIVDGAAKNSPTEPCVNFELLNRFSG